VPKKSWFGLAEVPLSMEVAFEPVDPMSGRQGSLLGHLQPLDSEECKIGELAKSAPRRCSTF
jgi:hypothetical protein